MLVTVTGALNVVHTEYGGDLSLTPVVRARQADGAGPRGGEEWVEPVSDSAIETNISPSNHTLIQSHTIQCLYTCADSRSSVLCSVETWDM